jgi:hypothetical protein
MRLVSIGLLACAGAWAQCSMCRTAAAAQGGAASKSMDLAIAVLLAPAVVLFCGIFAGIFRRSSEPHE